MVVPSAQQLVAYNGGQMTDLPEFDGAAFDGTELMEIVSPGNVEEGINYGITTQQLASLLAQLLASAVIISDGEYTSVGTPYTVPADVARVYVNKTSAEPTYILLSAASSYSTEPLVRDVAGTADDVGNGITVNFTGGQEADGNTEVVITSPYGGYFFRPISTLGQWTLGVG